VDAALSGIAGREAAVLERLSGAAAESPQRVAAIAALTGAVLRAKEDAASLRVLDAIADAGKPAWQRSSMLAGAEAAVAGVPLPGSGGRGRGAAAAGAAPAPCPTCPGSRSGPGGASAFPTTGARGAPDPSAGGRGRGGATAAGGGGRGRGGTTVALMLSREPALSKVAAEGGDLGKRATTVLERVGWPGKAGMAAAAAPLTPAEQQRFAAGQEIYNTVCAACHQPDGRGREKLAPGLVGSELALAAPGVPARILINGKEGPVGLMPPLGAGMADEQVAAVLTYIRRAWDQTGSAVAPADVATVRAAVAGRTRPWTNEELQQIIVAVGR
jgi:mono/diheme cytochrome c family protein